MLQRKEQLEELRQQQQRLERLCKTAPRNMEKANIDRASTRPTSLFGSEENLGVQTKARDAERRFKEELRAMEEKVHQLEIHANHETLRANDAEDALQKERFPKNPLNIEPVYASPSAATKASMKSHDHRIRHGPARAAKKRTEDMESTVASTGRTTRTRSKRASQQGN